MHLHLDTCRKRQFYLLHRNTLLFQYHGGTNFGRTASAFVTTSYYDQAPLDEYGMCICTTYWHKSCMSFILYIACFNLGLMRQPQWGHLTELHGTIKSCSKALLYGTPVDTSLGPLQQVRTSSVIMQFNSMLGVAIGFLKSSSALTYSGHCLQRITRNMCSISDKQ